MSVFMSMAVPGWSARRLWWLCGGLVVACIAVAVCLTLILVNPRDVVLRFVVGQGGEQRSFSVYPRTGADMEAGEQLRPSTLDASLSGVLQQGGRGVASIAVKGGAVRVYRQGDELARGVVLERIEPTRVVVREGAGLRAIELEDLYDRPPLMTGRPASDRAQTTPLGQARLTGAIVIQKSGALGYRIDALEGFEGRPGTVRTGDMVTALNGLGLSGLVDDEVVIAKLLEDEWVSVTVLREGEPLEVDLDTDLVRNMVKGL